jgi:hypothetical protein
VYQFMSFIGGVSSIGLGAFGSAREFEIEVR